MDNNWILVLIPRTSNIIVPSLVKYSKTLQELGMIKKYMDYTFVATSSTDSPLKNILSRDRFMIAFEYAMRKSIDNEQEIPFKVVEQITPMVSEAGMGLIIHSPFMKHLSTALGFTPNDIFFMIMATPAPGTRWSAGDVRTGTRIFENPDDGKFHCNVNPSQWNIGVLNKAQPEVVHAVVDLESFIPAIYTKIEVERLKLIKEAQEEQQPEPEKVEEPVQE